MHHQQLLPSPFPSLFLPTQFLPSLPFSHPLHLLASVFLPISDCNAAAYALKPPRPGFLSPPRGPSTFECRPSTLFLLAHGPNYKLNPPPTATRLHSSFSLSQSTLPSPLLPAQPPPRQPRRQNLRPPPTSRRSARRSQALASPSSFLPRAQYRASSMVGFEMCVDLYGRVVVR